jgi:hypothetical protein
MKLTKTIVALQKNLICPPNNGMDNKIFVATLQSHLMQWGYMLDEDAFTELSKSSLSFIENFNNEVISYLKNVTGGDINYKPLYKNFPSEVMSMSDFELYINAIVHYWSNGTWEPSTVEYEKPIKFEKIKYKIIKYGTSQKFSNIFSDLLKLNQSLTPTDLEVVKWFVNNGEKLEFPNIIPFKENLCTVIGECVISNRNPQELENLKLTTTDVLRIVVHLSGGDISLPKVPKQKIKPNKYVKSNNSDCSKFKKFTRKERKFILSLLENTNCDPKEMVLKDQRWIRLGEILHPMEYKKQFPKASNAFNIIRNEKIQSWYGILNDSFKISLENGLNVLSQRPGEFSRRIDWLVRKYPNNLDIILTYLNKSLKGTSNKVLFEVYSHFENRLELIKNRSVMIKGSRKRTELPSLPPISKDVVKIIHSKLFETLKEKFSTLDSLGNCWIDEELKKIPLPTNMRSVNFSTKPIIRGQRVLFDNPEAKVIRPFVHWMDKGGNEDLDLSITFVGKKVIEVLNYTKLKIGNSCHSGDVRHRFGACAEYVDIDVKDMISRGYQYAVIDVRNFNNRGLNSVNCMFGIMEREYPESNKIWLPETITSCQKLESESVGTLIAIIDLETKEYIMLDIDSSSINANGDINGTLKIVEQYSKLPKVSVYDLILLHVESRGKQVNLNHHVDTYFKLQDFITSYEETGKLMGV